MCPALHISCGASRLASMAGLSSPPPQPVRMAVDNLLLPLRLALIPFSMAVVWSVHRSHRRTSKLNMDFEEAMYGIYQSHKSS
eukprot:764360-Hanusia_phi.AAC.1